MKVLVIAGIRPASPTTKDTMFINERLSALIKKGVEIDVYSFSIKKTLALRVLNCFRTWSLKHIKSRRDYDLIRIGVVNYIILPIKIGLFDYLLGNRYEYLGKEGYKSIFQNTDLSEYDFIHAHWVYPHGYIAAEIKKRTGIPFIVSAHGSDIHTRPVNNPKLLPYVLYVLHNANKVLFASNFMLKTAKKIGYNGRNYEIVPNGIDTKKFAPIEKGMARKKLRLKNHGQPLIGYVGNLYHVKGADMLPDIFSAIKKRIVNSNFLIVGDGYLFQDIQNKCAELGVDVNFMGKIPFQDIPLVMNAIDLLIVPSRKEGFGNVVLEAKSCGCIVVGSNNGSLPEIIGEEGFFVDDNPIDNFAKGVKLALEKPITKEIIRKRALEYDWDIVIKKQIKTYKDLYNEQALFS